MASTQVVETSVTNNSPSKDSNHPDDVFQSRYVTPGFKPFSYHRVRYHIVIISINNINMLITIVIVDIIAKIYHHRHCPCLYLYL